MKTLSTCYRKSLLILLLYATCPFVVGQVSKATLSGTVTDATGAVLPGVNVMIEHPATKSVRAVITDEEGRYHTTNLQPGEYELRAELPGFRTTIRRGIQLAVAQQAVVNLTLEIGEVTEQVVVTGETPLVETATAVISALVGAQEIRELPLNGRDLIQLALLGTGITHSVFSASDISRGFGKKLSLGGSRPVSNSFLLDGTNINSNTNTTPGSVVGVQLGVDTIREFRVVTNPLSAEYGRASGGVISQVTRSGTNEFHGSAFEFHRNDNLDARNFFDPGANPAEFKRNQFGFTAGGPIRKDKAFVFGSYEGFIERLGLSHVAVVPNRLARQGLLPDPRNPGATRNVGVHPAIKPYLDLYPEPNGRDFGDGRAEFFSSPSKKADEHYFMVRVDEKLTESSSVFVRYTFDNAEVIIPESNGVNQDNLRARNQYLTLSEDHIFGIDKLNSFRFAFNRSLTSEFDSATISLPEALLFRPDVPDALPAITVTGLISLGGNILRPKAYIQNIFQAVDDFNLTRGAHSLKIGASYERIQFNQRSDFLAGGQYQFQALEDFLRNSPFNFGMQLPGSDTIRGLRHDLLGVYVQDDIQAARHWTFNVGLRYEIITSPTEVNGKLSQLIPFTSPTVTPNDIKIAESLFENPSLRNFAPRIGLAWDPFGNGKTSFRAGLGVFYEQILSPYWQLGTVRMLPFRAAVSITARDFGAPLLFPNWRDMGLRRDSVPGMEGFPHDPDSPYVTRWSASLDREISSNVALRVGYLGVRGVHLVRHVGVNLAVPTLLPDGRLFFPPGRERRINPAFSSTRFKLTDGTADYHGFELSVIKRYSKGFRGQLSYTLSKAMDNGAAVIGNLDLGGDNVVPRFRFGSDNGLSSFDVRNNVVFNLTYDFPKSEGGGLAPKILNGWQVSNITTLASGHPFSAFLGFVPPGFLAGSADETYYPNLRSGQSNNPRTGGPDRYFDGTVFALPEPGFQGDLGRNTLIGPGLANVDFSVVKGTPVGKETNKLEFRAEFFNLFNRPNFGLPQNDIFSAARAIRADVGRIRSTVTTSRQIQFGLKFSW